jgi:membrane protease YdiL (CAAX protease family)
MKKAILLLLFYLGYQLIVGLLMSAVTMIWHLDTATQLGCTLLLSGLAMTIHLITIGGVKLRETLRPVSPSIMLYSIICIVGTMVCCNALNELVSLPDWLEEDFTALSHNWIGALSIALMAPWVEELLFRGAIMPSLNKKGTAPWRGIILSSLLFGLIHVNPAQVLFAIPMGIAFGWIVWRTGSLLTAIIGHTLNNSFGVLTILSTDRDIWAMEESFSSTSSLLITAAIGLLVTIFTSRKLFHLTTNES